MYDLFHSLHVPGAPLVLANAWDSASARLTESAGVAAVGTTSAGVAWSLGRPDGGALDRTRALDVVRRIVAAVDVPVTADIEDGYADDPDGVGETVAMLVGIGAVGANIEDAWHGGPAPLRESADQVARIAAARAADAGVFLNARIDTYLVGVGDPQTQLAETLRRAAAYVEAGADGVFVPGVVDASTIAALVGGIAAPVNVMAGPGAPSVSELANLGVARVSLGASIAAACYGLVSRAAAEALNNGTYEELTAGIDYGELNDLLA